MTSDTTQAILTDPTLTVGNSNTDRQFQHSDKKENSKFRVKTDKLALHSLSQKNESLQNDCRKTGTDD